MAIKNSDVSKRWSLGYSGSSANMYTDGWKLYSYNLCIGYTCGTTGKKVLIDYTSKGGRFVSMTTSSKHIAPARKWADYTVTPDRFDKRGEKCHMEEELMEEPQLDPYRPIG